MKKLIIASLLTAVAVNANAITDLERQATNQATGGLVEGQIVNIANVDASLLAKINEAVAAAAQAQALINPSSVTEIITEAVLANPDKAAEIVQAAVEQYPDLVNEIIAAAVAAGADEDAMIVAALLGGANEEDIDLATAAGGLVAPTLSAAPSQTGLGGGTGGGGAVASPN
jgi:hypothetical protein